MEEQDVTNVKKLTPICHTARRSLTPLRFVIFFTLWIGYLLTPLRFVIFFTLFYWLSSNSLAISYFLYSFLLVIF